MGRTRSSRARAPHGSVWLRLARAGHPVQLAPLDKAEARRLADMRPEKRIYRVQQKSGIGFGTGHIMDIVRGKDTEKVQQFGHDKLSTFGLGKEYTEAQLRGVLRQLLATGAVGLHKVSMENGHSFDTLTLTDGSRPVLRGPGDAVIAGSHNLGAPVELLVERTGDATRYAGISTKSAVMLVSWRLFSTGRRNRVANPGSS